MRKAPAFESVGVHIDMTPMIDIVFQLLAFFIFTLRILKPEGDLMIEMPQPEASGAPSIRAAIPLRIELTAAADGSLQEIRLNGAAVADMAALRARVEKFVGDDPLLAAEARADLICDEGLAYHHTMDAITAVSGRRGSAGDLEPLVRKVRLARPEPRF